MSDFKCTALRVTKDEPKEKRALFSVYTGIDGKPFSIEVWLEHVTIQHSDDFIGFGVKISGCRHPCDGLQQLSNYIGDEQKNPALLPALQGSRQLISAVVDEALSIGTVRKALPENMRTDFVSFRPSDSGAYLSLHFSHSLYRNCSIMAFKELVPFYLRVKKGIKEIIPNIEEAIFNNAHLQLHLPPSRQDCLVFASTMAAAWHRAVTDAGITPRQMRGGDGLGDGPGF